MTRSDNLDLGFQSNHCNVKAHSGYILKSSFRYELQIFFCLYIRLTLQKTTTTNKNTTTTKKNKQKTQK